MPNLPAIDFLPPIGSFLKNINIPFCFKALKIVLGNYSLLFNKASLTLYEAKNRTLLHHKHLVFSSVMTSFRNLDIRTDDQTPHKWCISLGEEVFKRYFNQGNTATQKIFGDGSLFSPMLFGKFFDPSDAFPLWEFESDVLLSPLKSSGQSMVDWFQTDQDYVLKAEIIPGILKNNIQVCVDKRKVMEISGRWKQLAVPEPKSNDWRCGNWWEHGYVRRLEMPEDADWKNIEAKMYNDISLEIRIPKNLMANSDHPPAKDAATKSSDSE